MVRPTLLGLQVDVVPGDTVGPACGEDEEDDEDENEKEDEHDDNNEVDNIPSDVVRQT